MTNFFTIEQDIRKPNAGSPVYSLGHGVAPHGALWRTETAFYSDDVIRASDMGYIDQAASNPYPPRVQEAFAVDATVNLDPSASAVGASWGAIKLANNDAKYDSLVTGGWLADGRNTTILYGVKSWDVTRGLFTDPAYSTLAPAFSGVAGPWTLDDKALTIPLRDASYWLERPLLRATYGGNGQYDGTPALAGVLKPLAVGGDALVGSSGIQNVTPVLIDPAALIYQVTDGTFTNLLLYEGGYSGGIISAGDVADLYTGSTPAGQYRTCKARGCFQLGSTPTRLITCNVVCAGLGSTDGSDPLIIAYWTLATLCGVPTDLIGSVTSPAGKSALEAIGATSYSFSTNAGGCGFFLSPNDAPTGVELLTRILAPVGMKLVAMRDGKLRAFVTAALPGSPTIAASLDSRHISTIQLLKLPASVDPPPYRVRVGCVPNYTVQTSDLSPSATATRVQYISTAGGVSQANSASLSAALAKPNDPPVIGGSIVDSTVNNAGNIANQYAARYAALWGVRRRLYATTVPFSIGVALDYGDVVTITLPFDDLTAGQNGQVVGYSYRSADAAITLRVLV